MNQRRLIQFMDRLVRTSIRKNLAINSYFVSIIWNFLIFYSFVL